jgi:hypothetical protein
MKSDVLDMFRYIKVLRACIFSFALLIEWSFRMITHSLSGGGKGMKGYDMLDCTMIREDWLVPAWDGTTSSVFCRTRRHAFCTIPYYDYEGLRQ